jgi:hypothetical protein
MRRALLSLLILAGCQEPLEPLPALEGEDAACQPLLLDEAGLIDCLLPFPSDHFRVDGNIEIPRAATLATEQGLDGNPLTWRKADGYSRNNPILALLAEPVTEAGLTGVTGDDAATTQPTSRTLLLDTETGALVPHYADVDPRPEDRAQAALVIHPAVPLEQGRRYVVALQGIENEAGDPARPPEAFRRLRDARTEQDPVLDARAARLEDEVFAPLVELGVERSGLQLAWDFTTGSDDEVARDVLAARELALAWLDENTPEVVVEEIEAAPLPGVHRVVRGTVRAPLYLTSARAGAELNYGPDGALAENGTMTFAFTALIPDSVADAGGGGALFYGHGFFGGQDEVEREAGVGIAGEAARTAFALTWLGMSEEDYGTALSTIGGDTARAAAFTERVPQAFVNWLVFTRALQETLADDPSLADASGAPLVDAGDPVFVGISQGHILGSVLAALHPDLHRVVLQVGGGGFTSHIMFRAQHFGRFVELMKLALPNDLDHMKFGALVPRHFDRVDPLFWSRFLLEDELPSGPSAAPLARRVLLQMGVGDAHVPNIATLAHARALGIPMLTPAPSSVFYPNLETTTDGHAGSAIAAFDFGIDTSFYERAAPPDFTTYPHDGLRLHPEAHRQMRVFFDEGIVTNPCDGACELEQTFDVESDL